MLMVIAFVAGVGVTALGPGGIFLTIALFTLTSLSPASVAGTGSAMMVVAGVVGAASYLHSGELRQACNKQMAVVLSLSGLLGGLGGSILNDFVSRTQFGWFLAVVAFGAGLVILYREGRAENNHASINTAGLPTMFVLVVSGFAVGLASGLLGVGGPVLMVPVLVLYGIPILSGIAVAQVQSIFIALFATAGYASRDTIQWPLVMILSAPLVLGALVGWKFVRGMRPRSIKIALGVVLIAIAPYLAF